MKTKSSKNHRLCIERCRWSIDIRWRIFLKYGWKLVNTDNVTAGINTEVGKKQVAVDLDVIVEYGKDIEDIYNQIKELISTEVNNMTHLDVIEVNVNVADIKTQEEYQKIKKQYKTK